MATLATIGVRHIPHCVRQRLDPAVFHEDGTHLCGLLRVQPRAWPIALKVSYFEAVDRMLRQPAQDTTRRLKALVLTSEALDADRLMEVVFT